MRILTINYEYPPVGGGGGVAHKVLVDEWTKHHEITLITTRVSGQRWSEYEHGVRVYRASCLRRAQSAAELHALILFLFTPLPWIAWLFLKRKRIDVVNAQFAIPSGVIGVIAKKVFRVPLVVSIHGGDIYDPSKDVSPHRYAATRFLVSWVLSRADRIIAQSTNTADNARKYYRFSVPIEIIPLPLGQMMTPRTIAPSAETARYTFISIGRLVVRKGFDDLIDAFSRVHAQYPETTLCIIGRGPQEESLRNRVRELGLGHSVAIRTDVDDILKMQLLAAASCYVLSSLHEGYGIVLQEAIYAGIPIIATNNGGQTDFLQNKVNALLCNPSDVEALTSAMCEMYTHPELAKRCVETYPETLRIFDPKQVAARTMVMFKSLKTV